MNLIWQPGITMEQIKIEAVKSAMKWFRNDKPAAAAALNIAIRTIDNILANENKETKTD